MKLHSNQIRESLYITEYNINVVETRLYTDDISLWHSV